MFQQGISVDIFQNSAVVNFSPKTEGTKTKQLGATQIWQIWSFINWCIFYVFSLPVHFEFFVIFSYCLHFAKFVYI